MTSGRFVTRLRWFNFLLIGGALVVALGLATRTVDRALVTETEARVRAEMLLWGRDLARSLAREDQAGEGELPGIKVEIDALLVAAARETGAHLSLYGLDGIERANSDQTIPTAPHADPVDLAIALEGKTPPPLRVPLGLGRTRWDWTIPLEIDGRIVGAIHVSSLEVDPNPHFARMRIAFLVLATFTLLAGLWFTHVAARRLAQGLDGMRQQVDAFGRGAPAPPPLLHGWGEMEKVALALHDAAADMQIRLRDLSRQVAQQDALLASMIESVVAVDRQGMVLLLNPAAGRLFEVEPQSAAGRSLREIARQTALHQFVEQAQTSRSVISAELVLPGEPERCLLAHGATLLNAEGQRLGALIVLHDITQLRRLESHRREFVANVSHELKTPITSIKGFVETLRDVPPDDPGERDRFLGIILRQAERLHAIIEDLLSLSRLEQETEHERVTTEDVPAAEVLEAAVLPFRARAAEKEMRITVEVAADLVLRANPRLIEQAVANLVDNAIKYSEPGTAVAVRGSIREREAVLEVEDQGSGIESQHLERLFERFYRVDKGRSRRLGGTGLGLAIVKHIAQAHGGGVSVDSSLGRGSTFRIHLPLRDSRSSDLALTRS
ncbi:MAG: PAS domain-containing protein [Candidatus Eisenbacteria bacterium]|nr:PAS domain-containing protein [Candidatus Eisenbacteria bacterium]